MGFFKRRKLRKNAIGMLHHTRGLRRLREDLLPPAEVARLRDIEGSLTDAIRNGDEEALNDACEKANTELVALTPVKPNGWLRENAEVLLVAMGIAMAFRAYVAQPFKIPTGSMQPTLYGIHFSPRPYQAWRDAYPMRLANWLVTGEWYTRFVSQAYGKLRGPLVTDGTSYVYEIGGVRHDVPRNLALLVRPGDNLSPGQTLAEGVKINGDHIFVNRLIWNFRAPRRGEIMVFSTDDIPTLADKKTHYIKRMVGLPGESISIQPPNLVVNGHVPEGPAGILFNQHREPGYTGYGLPATPGDYYLSTTNSVARLGPGEYLAFGDNTLNSADSRYWGPVPQQNLVGPAMLIYWPFSDRYGITR